MIRYLQCFIRRYPKATSSFYWHINRLSLIALSRCYVYTCVTQVGKFIYWCHYSYEDYLSFRDIIRFQIKNLQFSMRNRLNNLTLIRYNFMCENRQHAFATQLLKYTKSNFAFGPSKCPEKSLYLFSLENSFVGPFSLWENVSWDIFDVYVYGRYCE